ncbi:MAG: helix-turn-helix domain-containing protein [Clostridia bacterium]|nr:helix-turn-helix domain-containing protein [Clostridia bacterium]
MKFGENLQKLRKSKKMSQEELAEKVEVSRQSISKWERGESYPTMNNIMVLCEIFRCNINDLVHESLTDINSLDEEIKMNVVKFKKEKQEKMKGISKAIYTIAKVGKIIMLISAIVIIISMVIIPVVVGGIDISDTEVKFYGQIYQYKVNNNTINIIEEKTGRSTDIYVDTSSNLQDYFTKHSTTYYILTGEFIAICLLAFLTIIFYILKYIEKLFVNIHNENTPFTMENIKYIRRIATLLIIAIIAPTVLGILFQAIAQIDMNVDVELMDFILVLIIFSMAYIFEYGYELQLDSKGKMYGDENE